MRGPGREPERGSALILLLVLSLVMVGFVSAFLSRGVRESRSGAGYRALGRARYAAEALLAEARTMIRTAPTDPEGRSTAVASALSGGAPRLLADGTPAVNEISGGDYRLLLEDERGAVWLTRLDGDYLRLEAAASVGMETAFLSETFLERVSLGAAQRLVPGLGVFPGTEAIAGAEDPFGRGDVIAVTPPPTEITDAEAAERLAGIPPLPPPGTVSPTDRPASFAYDVPFPDDGIFSRLLTAAGPAYRFLEGSDFTVEFRGSSVHVEALSGGDEGGPGPVVDLVLPDGGVIYVDGDVISLEGRVTGRVTLAVTGTVHVTGNLQYTDAEGRTAMLGGGGGGEYGPNPEYAADSVLGVVARGSIFYAPAMPPSSEVNASLFSQTGTIGLEMLWLDPALGLNESGFGVPIYTWSYTARGKATLRELGAKASSGIPVTKVEGTDLGFADTVSRYDPQLLDRPPPEFPTLPIPAVTAVRRVGGVEGLVAGSDRRITRHAGGTVPPVWDPEKVAAIREAVSSAAPTFGVNLGGQ